MRGWDSTAKAMTREQFDNLLLAEKQNYRQSGTHYHKAISISNQIQLKLHTNNFDKLSADIKLFISHHLKSLDEGEIHYDQLQLELIFNYIEKLPSHESLILTKFLLKQCKQLGYEDFIFKCSEVCTFYELKFLSTQPGLKNRVKQIYLYSIRDYKTILSTLFAFYLLYSLILLPAPYQWMALYEVKYVSLYDNEILNHFSNTLLGILDLDGDFKITPLNIAAIISMILAKLIFVVYIVNILAEELTKRFQK